MATARKTGRLGAVYAIQEGASLAKVADIFDWTFEATTEMLNCTTKGNSYDRFVPGGSTATIRAQAYLQTTANLTRLHENSTVVQHGAAGGAPLRVQFRLESVDGAATEQIEGYGWVSRASLAAPRGPVIDGFEITIDGEWDYSTA